MLEEDNKLGATQCCDDCGIIKPLEQGEAIIRYGRFVEFTCYQCKDKKTTQEKRDRIHLAMLEDFGNVIVKHLPNFDNNLEEQTWNFLVLFTEEAIAQLLEKGKMTTKKEKEERLVREWESNKCEVCFSFLRDCICEENN